MKPIIVLDVLSHEMGSSDGERLVKFSAGSGEGEFVLLASPETAAQFPVGSRISLTMEAVVDE